LAAADPCTLFSGRSFRSLPDRPVPKPSKLFEVPGCLVSLAYVNPINYQNGPHPEYIEMLRGGGFRLAREERLVDDASLRSLSHMKVAERFRKFSSEDLATADSLLPVVKD
jgi:hypothetical protein